MPTSLTFDEHLAGLESAGGRLVALVEEAGMDARVPSCPAWTARDLLAHLAMVHRWATAHVQGDDPAGLTNQTELRSVENLTGHYRDGLAALAAALREAAPDIKAMTFLKDAPAPREFWARRQCHETTIHMVDALAATVERLPTAGEVGVDPLLAADGIDELLRGFFTRGRSKLYDGSEYVVAVAPSDLDRRWVMRVAERLAVEAGNGDDSGDESEPEATITGTAAQLYLALWNRGDEAEVTGRTDLLDRWRTSQRVGWS